MGNFDGLLVSEADVYGRPPGRRKGARVVTGDRGWPHTFAHEADVQQRSVRTIASATC